MPDVNGTSENQKRYPPVNAGHRRIAVGMITAGVVMKIWMDQQNLFIYPFINYSVTTIKQYLLQNVDQINSLRTAGDMATRYWLSAHTAQIIVDINAVYSVETYSGNDSEAQGE